MKTGVIFANLKALENLFKDIERLQMSVNNLLRTLALSFKNLSGSLPMPAAFLVTTSLKIFSIYSFSAGSKSIYLVNSKRL